MEIYFDYILIKTLLTESLVSDLEETFVTIRWYDMKLNSEKCMFGVNRGQFLGHMIIEHGIEANPKK